MQLLRKLVGIVRKRLKLVLPQNQRTAIRARVCANGNSIRFVLHVEHLRRGFDRKLEIEGGLAANFEISSLPDGEAFRNNADTVLSSRQCGKSVSSRVVRAGPMFAAAPA
ncbi:MAG: hypothetical protein ABSG13_29670 [Bryobacteraceae bacterium]